VIPDDRPATPADERICPRCGATVTLLPILYGYPSHETFEAYERGEIQLGGCVVTDDDPEFACPACDAPLPTTKPVDHPSGTN
jgi:rubrerythrin